MSQIMYGFTKVRFTGTVYRPKGNAGTSTAVFYDDTGTVVCSINNACPTDGTREHIINFPFYMATSVSLTRYIDTRSNGNATMKIELFDSYSNKWIQVLYVSHYRTSDSWRTNSYNLSGAYASILNVMKDTLPLTLSKEGITPSTINLTKVKLTNPSMIFNVGSNTYYGALFDYKSGYTTLKVGNKYLTSIMVKLGSYSWSRNHWGGSNQTWSSWETIQTMTGHGFIHSINFKVYIAITSGNYDEISFQAYVMNKYDTSKKIYLTGHWGTGSNWTSNQSYSHTFTEEEKQKLGGPNTELIVQFRMMNNRGSSGMSSTYTFTLTTS